MVDKIKILLVSLKFHAFVVSSALFAYGTLSESGWLTVVLYVVGMKEGGKLLAAYRDIKTGGKVAGKK
jgi:hypothetical protein